MTKIDLKCSKSLARDPGRQQILDPSLRINEKSRRTSRDGRGLIVTGLILEGARRRRCK